MPPRITVLMPVFNAAAYVTEAARSILSSSFDDFELLAINDGSSDESEEKLRQIGDKRIRIVSNPKNIGLVRTLNLGLELAKGEFVARMDADDISMPHRLLRQLTFMQCNPEIGISGTWVRRFGHGSRSIQRTPLEPKDIHVQLFGYNALGHPTVIMRQELLRRHELRFSEHASHAEDLDLWMRAAENFPLANIPFVGLRYRVHGDQVSHRHSNEQRETLCRLRTRQLRMLIPDAAEAQTVVHLRMLDVEQPIAYEELAAIEQWLTELERANHQKRHYEATAFRTFLAQRWLNVAHRCEPLNKAVWRVWRRSRFASVSVAKRLSLFWKTRSRP